MSRYRLVPSPAQEATLREHCAHARFVWNLAVEQQSWWRPGRGVAASAALSTGELLQVPRLSRGRKRRLVLLQRRLARSQHGSRHRKITRRAIARLKARETDARKDWCEKVSTDLARRFDVIRLEDLRIQ